MDRKEGARSAGLNGPGQTIFVRGDFFVSLTKYFFKIDENFCEYCLFAKIRYYVCFKFMIISAIPLLSRHI